jgi:catechol 2,3-dioxygenase-like lactoylglutathione lyase family enzyme
MPLGYACAVMTKTPKVHVRAQPLIAVRDVEASTRWYSQLLEVQDLGVSEHAHIYQRLLLDGSLILQLHAWDEEHHPNLVNRDAAPVGHGVLLWFEVDDFDAAVKRARSLEATVVEEPHVNPAPQHREMWLRDPDGYVVVIASPDGEAG